MPDIFNANGLQISTLEELVYDLTEQFKSIYGEDINVEQNSPDGQVINIQAQAGIDLRELLLSINNSFDPDQATGVLLDSRVAINYITRKSGTFTIQPIQLTFDRTTSLNGLDADANNIDGTGYTVQDDAGNQFILLDSETFTAGTYERNFRAKDIGQVETTINTITNPVTIVLGVTNIDNPSGALEIGQNEETDAELRQRRQQSVALPSFGYLDGLLGTIANLEGVTDVKGYENTTNVTDSNGIPSHSIWVIVEGGANTDIADVIYKKKSYASGMKGAVEVPITTVYSDVFIAKFDRPTAENLYIRFDIQTTTAGAAFDQDAIKDYIVDNISYNIGQFAETSSITCVARDAINASGGGGVPVNVEISKDNISWFDYLDTTTLDRQFTLDATNITITEL